MKVTTKQAYTSPKLEHHANYSNLVLQQTSPTNGGSGGSGGSSSPFQLPSGF